MRVRNSHVEPSRTAQDGSEPFYRLHRKVETVPRTVHPTTTHRPSTTRSPIAAGRTQETTGPHVRLPVASDLARVVARALALDVEQYPDGPPAEASATSRGRSSRSAASPVVSGRLRAGSTVQP